MLKLGYKLSSEEHRPTDLIAQARRAEQCGFSFAMISDHFHPWIDAQGQSPFVWPVIGAIAQATEKLVIGTAVTLSDHKDTSRHHCACRGYGCFHDAGALHPGPGSRGKS